MPVILLCVFRFVRLLFSGHQAVAVENLALRLQLAAFRKGKKPVLTQGDRLLWVGISRLWSGWRDALVFVQPDTVVRWQRERFRKFWASLSQPELGRRGRPAIAGGIRRLILRMAAANPPLARPQNPWRTEDARDCYIGAHRLAGSPDDSFAPAVSDLEDISAQSPWRDRIRRFLHGADRPVTSFVRLLSAGAPAPRSASLQRYRSPHVRMGFTTDGRGIR